MANRRIPGRDFATMAERAWGMEGRNKSRQQIAETLEVGVCYVGQLLSHQRRVIEKRRRDSITICKAIMLLERCGYNVTKKPEN